MKQDSSSAARETRAVLALLLGLAACSGDGGGGDAPGDASAGAGAGGTLAGAGGVAGVGGGAGEGAAAAGSGSGASGNGSGGRGAGGSTGGAGAGGSTAGSLLSKYAACIVYARVLENRLNRECVGQRPLADDEHARREAECPDILFADGSNRTVDDVLRCTEQWRNAPCDELLDLRYPACTPNGERPLGAACIYSVQCSSGRCGGTPDAAGCKRCVVEAAVGAACTDPAVQCPYDAPCDGQVCTDYDYTKPTSAECGEGKPCAVGSRCTVESVGVLVCKQPPGLGQPCPELQCDVGLVCSYDTNTCVALPALDQPCPDGQCEADAYCREGLVFDPAPMELPSICTARHARGDECVRDQTVDELQNGYCALDLVCACDDDACMTAHCALDVGEGEACDAPFSHCTLGTACVSGVCAGVESQGLSDACQP